jgi:TetR/AcrR family transcriptional repressor of mexJK operon
MHEAVQWIHGIVRATILSKYRQHVDQSGREGANEALRSSASTSRVSLSIAELSGAVLPWCRHQVRQMERAESRHEELLDAALEEFLERGFELTTIEMIATRINMTKRTVYARYADKASLFRAAVQRAIERQVAPQDVLEGFEQSAKPVIGFVAGLLDRAITAGQISPTDSGLAASAFMSMVVGGQVRAIVSGRLPTPAEMDKKVHFAVQLLLDGLRPR